MMKRLILATALLITLSFTYAQAQQTTGTPGSPNEVAAVQGVHLPVEAQMQFYDAWGSDRTYPHMSVGWTWAFGTPFSWTKMVSSHFGGTKQGTAISWPAVIKDKGGIRNQFHHVIDIAPTTRSTTMAGSSAPRSWSRFPRAVPKACW